MPNEINTVQVFIEGVSGLMSRVTSEKFWGSFNWNTQQQLSQSTLVLISFTQ